MSDGTPPARPASYDKKVGLVLQGGGALGSYQAVVFEALASSEYLPDWVAGISIGAINAAIIAGNAPEHRVQRLQFLGRNNRNNPDVAICSRRTAGGMSKSSERTDKCDVRPTRLFHSAPTAGPVLNEQLRQLLRHSWTLERFVNFDRISSAKDIRLSVGAVNVRTAQFAYFDSEKITIRPEHVMASGTLPPAFPPVEIDGEQYWDGGLFSNTPLQYMVDYSPRRSRLIFQVDLFPAHGCLPDNLDEANEREKDVRYSSRTRLTTDILREKHDVRFELLRPRQHLINLRNRFGTNAIAISVKREVIDHNGNRHASDKVKPFTVFARTTPLVSFCFSSSQRLYSRPNKQTTSH
jgi:NTE family protein